MLKLQDFSYQLPEELIAQTPLAHRSGSRLLIRMPGGGIQHSLFHELPDILPPSTHIVFNDSRVIPGRLLGKTPQGGKIEIMLLRPAEEAGNAWFALGKPFRKLSEGFKIQFSGGCEALVVKRLDSGQQPSLIVRFNLTDTEFLSWMEQEGYIPLPPYIHRKDASAAPDSPDRERYQTIYAKEKGSVAAPTAGLHFSDELWKRLEERGMKLIPITLHVGGGTFLPVKHENLGEHLMHTERYRISSSSYRSLKQAQAEKHPIVAIGTTSLRCLESFARREEHPETLLDQWLETNLFLYPKDESEIIRPWAINGLLTNFHQPESSLLMLVAALVGYKEMKKLYATAIEQKYRFFSYGDASLLWLG